MLGAQSSAGTDQGLPRPWALNCSGLCSWRGFAEVNSAKQQTCTTLNPHLQSSVLVPSLLLSPWFEETRMWKAGSMLCSPSLQQMPHNPPLGSWALPRAVYSPKLFLNHTAGSQTHAHLLHMVTLSCCPRLSDTTPHQPSPPAHHLLSTSISPSALIMQTGSLLHLLVVPPGAHHPASHGLLTSGAGE